MSANQTSAGQPTDTAGMHEVLGAVKATLGTIEQQFRTIHEQSAKIEDFGPDLEHASTQIDGLRRQIRREDKTQQARINDVKELVRTQLKNQAVIDLKPHIQAEIRRELAEQIREQITLQIKDHIPVSLHEQAAETKESVLNVKNALNNSEARRKNSSLCADDMDDALAVVLKPDGTKSDLYPHNLNSLFVYDDDRLHLLLSDYELSVQPLREQNLNRFMAHIGVGFRLVPIPGLQDQNETAPLVL